jgi:hypothetical protein
MFLIPLLAISNFGLHYFFYKKNYSNGKEKSAFLYSYNLTSIISYLIVSGLSLYSYYSGEMQQLSLTFDNRITGEISTGYLLGITYIGYDIYALIISIYLKNWTICFHHIGMIYMIYFTINYQVYYYYLIFYAGVTSISTIPLSFINIFKEEPDLKEKYPNIYQFNRYLFTILFIYIRIFMLAKYNYYLNNDIYIAFYIDKYQSMRYILVSFSILNILFTILQLIWCKIIIKGLIKNFRKNTMTVKKD